MLPGELQKGDRLTADWINRLVREAVSRTLNAGPGLRLTRTPSGTTVSLAHQGRVGGAGGLGDYPWRVTAAPDGEGGVEIGMSDGRLLLVAPGAVQPVPVTWDGDNASNIVWVVARIQYSISAQGTTVTASVGLESSVPASSTGDLRLPVAHVHPASRSVEQWLWGCPVIYALVAEEI